VTLNSNGTGSFNNVTQTGWYLIVNQSSLSSADLPPASGTFEWMYNNGVVTLSNATAPSLNGQTFIVGVGGRVMTKASSNSDGTDALIIMTRLQ
jgi:hypothetical protein